MKTGSLNGAFLRRLARDGFCLVGWMNIAPGAPFEYELDLPGAGEWPFCVFALVSFADGGTVARIGKSEQALTVRLNSFHRDLQDAMSNRLGPTEHFKGGTQRWELAGWLDYVAPYGGGLIFARQVAVSADVMKTKLALETDRSRLIAEYNPPLSGDSPAGRQRRAEWVTAHGEPVAVSKDSLDVA